MGWNDLNTLARHAKVQITALCDVDSNTLDKAAKAFPGAHTYADWRELLDKEGDQIDSVNVAVPDHMHFAIAHSAIQKGKHVYCQKPMCHDVTEVRALTEASIKKGVVTQLGTQMAAGLGERTVVHLLKTAAIGKIKHAYLCSNRPGAVENYRLPGPRPASGKPPPALVSSPIRRQPFLRELVVLVVRLRHLCEPAENLARLTRVDREDARANQAVPGQLQAYLEAFGRDLIPILREVRKQFPFGLFRVVPGFGRYGEVIWFCGIKDWQAWGGDVLTTEGVHADASHVLHLEKHEDRPWKRALMCSKLFQLATLGEEPLREQRQTRCRARGDEVGGTPVETLVDQYRDRRSAGSLELGRQPRGIRAGAEVAGGR